MYVLEALSEKSIYWNSLPLRALRNTAAMGHGIRVR
jgi:hypothetical protein